MRDQLAGLGRRVLFGEITIDTAMQVLCLTHIDDLPVLIKVLVHTRALRYAFQ